ncbi:hypothetical protein [Paraburkholderia jirisanensis]
MPVTAYKLDKVANPGKQLASGGTWQQLALRFRTLPHASQMKAAKGSQRRAVIKMRVEVEGHWSCDAAAAQGQHPNRG